MSDFVFFQELFRSGEAILAARPCESEEPSKQMVQLLKGRFLQYRSMIAGPLIEFDLLAAWQAARVTAWSCWFLVSHEEPPEVLEQVLSLTKAPRLASEHLSMDLTLRYMVTVHQRAHAMQREDVLTKRLAVILNEAPLSGVLDPLIALPSTEIDLGNHPGLQMLFAERLLRKNSAHWVPTNGPFKEIVELVFQQAGREIPKKN